MTVIVDLILVRIPYARLDGVLTRSVETVYPKPPCSVCHFSGACPCGASRWPAADIDKEGSNFTYPYRTRVLAPGTIENNTPIQTRTSKVHDTRAFRHNIGKSQFGGKWRGNDVVRVRLSRLKHEQQTQPYCTARSVVSGKTRKAGWLAGYLPAQANGDSQLYSILAWPRVSTQASSARDVRRCRICCETVPKAVWS